MMKINPPNSRSHCVYPFVRIALPLMLVLGLMLVAARSSFTSTVPHFSPSFCTTDPVVINNLDSGAGSLRQAIIEACDGSTITFNMTAVTSPITLTSGELLINQNVTIIGPGANVLTVARSSEQATPPFRIFNVVFGTVNISGLTITNGHAPDGVTTVPVGQFGENGGGVRNQATLTMSDVRVIGNRSGRGADAAAVPGFGGKGGGIFSESGSVTMTNSTVSDNHAGDGGFSGQNSGARAGDGGGIFSHSGALTLTNVVVTNNAAGNTNEGNGAGGSGGGVFNNVPSVGSLTECTVSGNSSGDGTGFNGQSGFGGGVETDGPMTITRSTISGNTSHGPGGGFISRTQGNVSIINSTISGNSAGFGGGIFNDIGGFTNLTNSTITNNLPQGIFGGNNVSVRNTIIAGNGSGSDISSGALTSLGNNLIGNATGAGFTNGVNGDKVGTAASPLNPQLGPLANNGGPTQTHALLSSSLALDAGNNCVVDNTCSPALGVSLTTDQRGNGFSRAADSGDAGTTQTVDIGAFEAHAAVEDISDKAMSEDTVLSFSFGVGDAALITNVSVSSANTALVPNDAAHLHLTGSQSGRSLDITPLPNQFGTSVITLTVTSGTESMSDTFLLTVAPVNDAPTDIILSSSTVADNSAANTLVGTLTAADPDPLDTFTFSLVSGAGAIDNASFTISGNQLRTAAVFDFESKPSYQIRVRVTDAGNLQFEKLFTINVIDGPDTPGAISFTSANFSVNEGAGNANITLSRTGGTDNRVIARVDPTDVTTSPADYVYAPGSKDTTFNTGTGATSGSTALPQYVDALQVQPDGKVLIGGAFLFYNGVPRNRIARLNTDGSLDASFDPGGTGADNHVYVVTLQPDGKILIGGVFDSYNGVSRTHIARLNSDGTLDQTFFNSVPNDHVRAIVVQPDGKILVGGDFNFYNGVARNRVVRLNSDGSVDFSFNPPFGSSSVCTTLALQPDGRVIVGGSFDTFGSATNTRIVRLDSSGALDPTFNSALGISLAVRRALLQPDGKILVVGEWVGNDTPFGNKGIARLETTGAIDATFNPGTGTAGNTIEGVALQPDGKIVIVGWFPTFNGTTVNGVARLTSAGAVDSSFNSGLGINVPFPAFIVTLQDDGKIVMGGQYTFFNGLPDNGITRLNGDLFVTWAPGDAANKTLLLPIVNDTLDEPNETLSLHVTPVSGGALAGVTQNSILTIVDNDPTPTAISAVSGSGVFGGTATLTAKLTSNGSNLSGKTVNFTINSSAAGNAVTGANGVATLSGVSLAGIGAGNYPLSVGASFTGDGVDLASSSGNGPLTVTQAASATAVTSSVNPSEFGQSVTFTATATSSGGPPDGTVQFKDGNSNLGSAIPLNGGVAHLTTSSLSSGTHTITAVYSGNGNFIGSSGALTGGQVVKTPVTMTINDVSVAEGNSGTTNLVFTVTLSATSTLPISIDYATADGTATTSDGDYQSASGTLVLNPGQLSKTITVLVNGDQKTELDETLFVNLNNPVNVLVNDAQGVGTISNDDDLQLIIDESGPAANQAAALDSYLYLRDPFHVQTLADWLPDFGPGGDRNTRVVLFAGNLTLNNGELPSAVVVSLGDSSNQTFEVPAEDVRMIPGFAFTQVVFRLPNGITPGNCAVTLKYQGRTSNTATFRIAP